MEGGRTVVSLLAETKSDIEGLKIRTCTEATPRRLGGIKVQERRIIVLLLLRRDDENVGHLLHRVKVLGWWGDEIEVG